MSESLPTKTETQTLEHVQRVLQDLFERSADFGLRAGSPEFSETFSPDNHSGGIIDVERNGVALQAKRIWQNDETLLNPKQVEMLTVTADISDMSRAQVIISDGRLLSADYIDNIDSSKTIRNNPQAGLQPALQAIELALESIKSAK